MVIIPECPCCKNYKVGRNSICEAFPDGIPSDYLWGNTGIDVTELKECDNGYKFEKQDEE